MNFISLFLIAYIQSLVENGLVVSEESFVLISYVNDLGPSQETTLTLNTHTSSIPQLFVCIFQLSGHRLQ